MTLLRDLITIPEQVFKGDYVLKLVDGVTDAKRTLQDYVATPQLVDAFDQALGLVRSAIEGKQSKAAFLHGSFGSGKSHFMAVLHLLLAQDRTARAVPELAPVVAKHRWLEGKKFLLVPFHMIGAKSLEAAIFGQYVRHVGVLHPEAPIPPVFLGDPVLEQADDYRKNLGDSVFFAKLGASQGGWGDLHAWDAASYDAARSAPPNDERRRALISAVVTNLLPAYHRVAGADGEGYVAIDEGLSILTAHAKELGYDALVFFLDEVILWLASMVADLRFVNDQGAKLAKLVEAQGAPRPIPLVSILARQRDLRELVGTHVPGAEKLGVFDVLKWWGGRFDTIKLEDRNLPVILEKRLLRPKSELAKGQLDQAFADTKRVRREVFDTLLAGQYREDDFRRVYPFSPALVETLVAVSSVLQRERTAIKALMQLLVTQRDSLEVGQLVPVGDLFDVIADGEDPFSEGMRLHFDNAMKLYRQKLRPTVLASHALTEEGLASLRADDPKRKTFRNDDRLVKTLLLAALVPEVPSLRGMTAARLVALNHGTIKAPIPGQEASLVLHKLRTWAASIGEVRLTGDMASPTVHLEIGSVDTESILSKVRREDSPGARKAKVRELLYQEFGIVPEDRFREEFAWVWRGTRRSIDVVYGNVRDMPADNMMAKEGRWLLVIDFPFDDGYSPEDDLRKLEEVRRSRTSRTVCWIPAFLSLEILGDLGNLVVLDYLLNENNEQRYLDNASHLPPVERMQAKSLLEGQRSAVRNKVLRALEAAYGVSNADPGMLGASIDIAERFQCLEAGQSLLSRPSASGLRQAIEMLATQMLNLQFPKHPQFPSEVRSPAIKRAYEWLQKAARDPLHRTIVDKERRREVREIVEPLSLGEMGEDALRLRDYWTAELERKVAQARGEAITVGQLRRWIEEQPRGLSEELQDLVILTFAEATNRRFLMHGASHVPGIDRRLDNGLELRAQQLPVESDWSAARDHAAAFGIDVASHLGAANVGKLIDDVKKLVAAGAQACQRLEGELRNRLELLQVAPTAAARWQTAKAVVQLCADLQRAADDQLVETLARAKATHSWQTMGTSFKQADAVLRVLASTQWATLETAWAMGGAFAADAEALKRRVIEGLQQDEHVVALDEEMRRAMLAANELLRRLVAKPVEPSPVDGGKQPPQPIPAGPARPVVPPPPPPPPPMGKREIDAGDQPVATVEELRALVKTLEGKLAAGKRTLEVRWRILEEDARR